VRPDCVTEVAQLFFDMFEGIFELEREYEHDAIYLFEEFQT
jgi:hypothetical protein